MEAFFNWTRARGDVLIFVTVGTHEQPFDRLIINIDGLKGKGVIQDDVVIQTGFSNYQPKNCEWKKLFSYQEMMVNVAEARIVITHGGPSSFFMPLQVGKIPVVVPRQKKFGEHVNDHQVDFARAVAERKGNIIVIEKLEQLEKVIMEYESIVRAMPKELQSNNAKFNETFASLVEELFDTKLKSDIPGK